MGGAKERGCREDGERERVCSHSEKGEEVQGKRSESGRGADAELKAGGEAGFRTKLPGHQDGRETCRNCFLIKGGWVRAANDSCFKCAGK